MKISVVVPVYNVENYLEECIESLLQQTVRFHEIILLNDGSTDESQRICEKYCNRYLEIKLINKDNQGLAATRNLGIRLATGDYIIFVDSDDYIVNDLNSKLKSILQHKKVDVLYYNAKVQYDISSKEHQNAFKHPMNINGCIMTGIEYFNGVLSENHTISACVAAYQKSFLQQYNILFPEGIYFEDHFFALQVITNANTIMSIPDSLYIRRCREGSIMTSEITPKKCLDLATSQRIIWKYLKENKIWNNQRLLMKKYLSSEILNTFYEISHFSKPDFVKNIFQKLSEEFLENWFELFTEEKNNNWSENLAFYLIIKNIDRQVVDKYFEISDQYNKVCKNLVQNITYTFLQKIASILSNETRMKIGIYGIGNHTQELLKLYYKSIGKIQHELFFIVSDVECNKFFQGKPVYGYQNIPKDTDYILLSSKVYQNDMRENLLHVGIQKNKIISLYDKNDICDLVMMNWVLNQ